MRRARLTPVLPCLLLTSVMSLCPPVRAEPAATRDEIGLFPLAGGDTDLGIGGGAFSSLAHFEPGYAPYRYRIEAAAVITFKASDSGVTSPYQDDPVRFAARDQSTQLTMAASVAAAEQVAQNPGLDVIERQR
jgi:hypothetical protein